MYRLLVFDWDGTLMDSEQRIVSSALAAVRDLDVPPPTREQVRDIIGLGLREAVATLFPDTDIAFQDAFIDRYRHHFLVEDHTPMPLFEGARETLLSLHDAGYWLAVATGKARRGLDRVLAETGLRPLFLATRCADETRSKPHPQMLLELMDELGVAPEDTLMVGDTEYDLQMAINARVASVAAAYGVHSCERLLQFAPLACLGTIRDLAQWLERGPG